MFHEFLSPAGIIGLLGMLAAGWGLTKHATVKTLQDTNEARGIRIEDLEAEVIRKDKALAAKDRELGERDEVIASKDRDLEAVAKVVTGEAHWVAIEHLIADLTVLVKALADKVDSLLRRKS